MRIVCLLLLLLLQACEIFGSSDDPAANAQQFAIETQQTVYQAVALEEDDRFFSFEIVATFTNLTHAPVYFVGCLPPQQPLLDIKEGNEWKPVYQPIQLLCLSEPLRLVPGDTLSLPHVYGACYPDNNCGPTFDGPVTGTYRLRQFDAYYDPEGTKPVEIESLVSNTFTLKLP